MELDCTADLQFGHGQNVRHWSSGCIYMSGADSGSTKKSKTTASWQNLSLVLGIPC